MVELKDRQQQETEGKLQCHARLTLMAQVLVPCWNQIHRCTLASLKVRSSNIGI